MNRNGIWNGNAAEQNEELSRKAVKSKFLPYVYRDDRRRSRFVICKANEVTHALQREGGEGGWRNRNGIWNGNAAEQNERNFSGKKEDAEDGSKSGPNESDT
ncbi:hypothetical protein CEXT_679001 [Caerostris extrusa]|uniref:Uncharacterized protein n=1 Tax=Caerostris extrusa TaxID=172846 RepID=A0AAV4Y5H6_CAEEX|nr:hypothetical protein CEXT_679001 [Caerostris extrusa]